MRRRITLSIGIVLILALLAIQVIAQTDPNDPDAVHELVPQAHPLLGETFIDPVFGNSLRRVSDASERGSFGTHIYSQLQAFSDDNAYILLIEDGAYVVRRLDDLSLVEDLDTASWNAPRWYPAQKHTIVHFDSNADDVVRVQLTSVDTATTETLFTFPAQYQYVLGNQSFDELSHDGRWLAGALTRDDGVMVIVSLDTQTPALAVEMALPDLYATDCEADPEWGELEPDWVGVSPLGNYLVVQWVRDGVERCSGLETFDIQTGEFVGRVYDGHQHGDLGVLPDGGEFFMTFETFSPMDNNRPAIGLRLLPGNDTASPPEHLLVMDWADDGHISCQGPPGVCLITNGGWQDDGWTPFERELFLLYTDGTVQRLTHHRSSSCGYWVQPRASISRDGQLVVFASDWGHDPNNNGSCDSSAMGQGDAYVLEIGE